MFKGTVRVILRDSPHQNGNARKVFNPDNFSSLSYKQEMIKSLLHCRETMNQNKQFSKT